MKKKILFAKGICMWWQRKSEGEHESSRRLKTQFLIEMEGFDSGSEQILLIGDVLTTKFHTFLQLYEL